MEIKTKYNIGDKVNSIYFDNADLKYYASFIPKVIQDIRIEKEDDKFVVRYRVDSEVDMLEEDLYPDPEQAKIAALKRSINSINNRISELKEDVENIEKVLYTFEPSEPEKEMGESSKKVDVREFNFWLHLNTNSYFIEISYYQKTDEYTCTVSDSSAWLWEWTFDSKGETYADFPNNDVSNTIMEYLFTKVFK